MKRLLVFSILVAALAGSTGNSLAQVYRFSEGFSTTTNSVDSLWCWSQSTSGGGALGEYGTLPLASELYLMSPFTGWYNYNGLCMIGRVGERVIGQFASLAGGNLSVRFRMPRAGRVRIVATLVDLDARGCWLYPDVIPDAIWYAQMRRALPQNYLAGDYGSRVIANGASTEWVLTEDQQVEEGYYFYIYGRGYQCGWTNTFDIEVVVEYLDPVPAESTSWSRIKMLSPTGS